MSIAPALLAIREPYFDRTLGELGLLTEGESGALIILLPVSPWPSAATLRVEIEQLAPGTMVTEQLMSDLQRSAMVASLRNEMVAADGSTSRILDRQGPTRIIGVSSGKGGVGKSSVTVNLAIALSQAGQRVGVLDADVYGFSIPNMLGGNEEPVVLDGVVLPTMAHGIRCMSMGYFIPDDQPVIWRGPMLHKAVQQLITETWWNEPDFLLIDMPPGTGDVALTLSEVATTMEIVVVTTPQPAAQRVAQRSAFGARKMKLVVRGVIENMSWFVGDDGKRYELFGAGGGARLAADVGVPLLAQIPLESALRQGGDDGRPIIIANPTSDCARAFTALAQRLIEQGPTRRYRPALQVR